MRKILGVIFIALVLVACGGSEKISQDTINEFKFFDTEITVLQKAQVYSLATIVSLEKRIEQLEASPPQAQNEAIKRLTRLQREYALGTIKVNRDIITLSEFDMLISSLVRGDQTLEMAWTDVANGNMLVAEFEIIMWGRLMDAIAEHVSTSEETTPDEEGTSTNG